MEQGVLLHPILIHFPIAFYLLEAFLLFLWLVKKDEAYQRFAWIVFRLGYLLMIFTVWAGLSDAGGISGIRGKVRPHAFGAASVFGVYTLRALYWWRGKKRAVYPAALFVSALLGSALVAVTAYFGGEIVYG
jgi:uncharacterized membrane protein